MEWRKEGRYSHRVFNKVDIGCLSKGITSMILLEYICICYDRENDFKMSTYLYYLYQLEKKNNFWG